MNRFGTIAPADFTPAWWLSGPHAQTLWPALVRRARPVPLARRRVAALIDERAHHVPLGTLRGVRERWPGRDDRGGARHESGSREQRPGHASTNRCATSHQHPRPAVTAFRDHVSRPRSANQAPLSRTVPADVGASATFDAAPGAC